MAVKYAWDPQRPMPSADEETLLTKKEAAEYLGVKLKRIERLRRDIPYFKVGRTIRFSRDDLDAYLEANRVVPGPDGQ